MIWIRNGRVVDGSGAPERAGDVLKIDARDPGTRIRGVR